MHPGGGWTISSLTRVPLDNGKAPPTIVNRAVIAKGEHKQLVYYWFRQRGMEIADEMRLRLLLFCDGLFENRTDVALVRLTTPVFRNEDTSVAYERLPAILNVDQSSSSGIYA